MTSISDQTTKKYHLEMPPINQAPPILLNEFVFYLDLASPSDILTTENRNFSRVWFKKTGLLPDITAQNILILGLRVIK